MPIFNLRGPSLGRNRSDGKENRARSTTTYAFLLRIVQGASYQHAEQIETVALFNESCSRNYVSSQFAKNRLQILDKNTEEDVDRDCWLVWVCEGLGRYQQRTVFWIAKNADFDLLFGYEQNQNTRDHQNQQFQNGINNGTLKTELPRWKSFQGGIKDDFLLPVGRVADEDYPSGSPRMPSLADIKGQLAVQLSSSSERKRQHDKEKALNTLDSRHIRDQADFFCGEDPSDSTAPVIIKIPERDKFNLLSSDTLAIDDSKQPIFKGNKRTYLEPQSSSLTGEPEELHRLPKVRNARVGCPCRCVAANLLNDGILLERENPIANGNLFSPDSNALSAASAEEHPMIFQDSEMSRVILEDRQPSRRPPASTEEELLFSGMDRDDSPCTSTILRGSSSISLSSKSLDIQPISREFAAIEADVRDPIYQPTRKPKKGKRKRRPKTIDKPLIATAECHDKKFHEFWKRDEAKGNWFHVDKVTSKITWYEAPPWSTSPSSTNDTLSETTFLA